MRCKKCNSLNLGFNRCLFKDKTRHIFTKCKDCRYSFYSKVCGVTLSLTEGQEWKSLKHIKKQNKAVEKDIKVKKIKKAKERVKCMCGKFLKPIYRTVCERDDLHYNSTHWACKCGITRSSYFEQQAMF